MRESSLRRIVLQNRDSFANFLSFVATRLLAIGLFAISVPIFVTKASATEYGVVAIGFSFLGLSLALDVAFGYVVSQSVGRRLARTNRPSPEIFNRLVWLYLLSTGVIAAVAVVVLVTITELPVRERAFFVWLPLLLPFLSISGVVAAVFQAHNDLVYLNTSRFIFELGKGGSLILSGVLFGDLTAVGPVLLAVAAVRAWLDIVSCKARLGYELNRPKITALRRSGGLVAFGVPALGSVVLTLAVTIGDKLLILIWYSTEDVAHYSLAFDLNTKAYLIVNAINTTMFPRMLSRYATGRPSRSHIGLGLASVGIVSLFFYVPLAMFAERVLSLWISQGVALASSSLTRVLAFSCIVYLFGNVFENALLAGGRSREVFKVYCLAVGVYFLSVSLLQKWLGVIGFGWAYFALSAVLCAGMVITYAEWHKARGFDKRPVGLQQ